MHFNLEAFERVIKHFSLGHVHDLQPILVPTLNPALLMNGRILIEISTDEKFENPVFAMQLLADMAVPVPKVMHVDNTRHLFDFSVLILEQENGATLEDSWIGLSNIDQQTVAFKAGWYLAQCHRQQFSQFGSLVDIQKEQANMRWFEWIDAKAQWFLLMLEQAHLLSPLLIIQARHKVSRNMSLCKKVSRGVLCHGNFDLSRVLARRGECVQLIQFDRALSADPAWDFREYRSINAITPGALSVLCEGYQSIYPFDETFFARAEFYALISVMENICLARHFEDIERFDNCVARFKGLLDG